MKQTSLFDPAPPYQPHSDTSKQAAHEIEPKARTLRASVFYFIRISGAYGATDEEIQTYYDMEGSTERPRRIELVEMGKVKDSGKTRKTKSGRQATVWISI